MVFSIYCCQKWLFHAITGVFIEYLLNDLSSITESHTHKNGMKWIILRRGALINDHPILVHTNIISPSVKVICLCICTENLTDKMWSKEILYYYEWWKRNGDDKRDWEWASEKCWCCANECYSLYCKVCLKIA